MSAKHILTTGEMVEVFPANGTDFSLEEMTKLWADMALPGDYIVGDVLLCHIDQIK